jgi:hypothetical protein
MIHEISYKALQEISILKWCYDVTIRDCIDCILYQYEKKLDQSQKDEIFNKVKSALTLLQKMESKTCV